MLKRPPTDEAMIDMALREGQGPREPPRHRCPACHKLIHPIPLPEPVDPAKLAKHTRDYRAHNERLMHAQRDSDRHKVSR